MLRRISDLLEKLGNKRTYAALLLFRCPFDILLTIVQAVFLQQGFAAMEAGRKHELLLNSIGFGIANIGLFLYNGVIWRKYARFSTRIAGRLRRLVYGYILRLSLEKLDEKSSGEWITRMNRDAQMSIDLMNAPCNIPTVLSALLKLTISSILLFRLQHSMLVITLVFVLPHVWVHRTYIYKPFRKLVEQSQERLAENMNCFSSFITCSDTLRLYDGETWYQNTYEESSLAMVHANLRMHWKKASSAILMPIFGIGGYMALLLLGCTYIRNGQMDFGALTAVFQYRGGVLLGTMLFLDSVTEIRKNQVGLVRLEDMYGGNATKEDGEG